MACRSPVMVKMAILGISIGVLSENKGGVQWQLFLWNMGGVRSICIGKGSLCQFIAFSSLIVVPNFPSMLFSYLFTPFSLFPLVFPQWSLAAGYNMIQVLVLGMEFSSHFSESPYLSYVMVARGLGENGRNGQCNICATQPKGRFCPPPSYKINKIVSVQYSPSISHVHSIV